MTRLARESSEAPGSSYLTPFRAGDTTRFVAPATWGGEARRAEPCPPGTVCEVEVPARLHASVLDMNRFGVGQPGGGGIGFAVGLYSRARAVVTERHEVLAGGARPALAQHLAGLFRHLTGFAGGFDLEVTDHGHRHMGLGSSIGTLIAAAVALNELLGRPLSLRDVRKFVAYNYCEEAPGPPDDLLVQGFETNVGAMAAIHGGMVVASDACELVYRTALPLGTRALLLVPALGPRVSSGEPEARALLARARALDDRDAAHKAYRVLMELLPAMVRGDLAAVGDVLYELAADGSKSAECRLHGKDGQEIYEALGRLRNDGAEVVGMSSVGPAVFALSPRPEVWETWPQGGRAAAADQALIVPADNVGVRVRLDGVPLPYRFEPWWTEPGERGAAFPWRPAPGSGRGTP